MKVICHFFFLLTAFALLPGTAKAVNWNELFEGEFFGDGNAPTSLFTLGTGSNLIEGTISGVNGVATDIDIWNFTIAAGYYLSGINLVTYSDNGFGAPLGTISSFMAIDDALTINTGDPSQHLSNGLWNEQSPDGGATTFTNLLAILEAGPEFGGTGFSGPLPAGDYTFWVQETASPGVTLDISYCIEFVVTPVPEPGSAVLLGLAGLALMIRRRSRL